MPRSFTHSNILPGRHHVLPSAQLRHRRVKRLPKFPRTGGRASGIETLWLSSKVWRPCICAFCTTDQEKAIDGCKTLGVNKPEWFIKFHALSVTYISCPSSRKCLPEPNVLSLDTKSRTIKSNNWNPISGSISLQIWQFNQEICGHHCQKKFFLYLGPGNFSMINSDKVYLELIQISGIDLCRPRHFFSFLTTSWGKKKQNRKIKTNITGKISLKYWQQKFPIQ